MWPSPKAGGSYPGVVVIQEAFGVNDHMKKVTERIAAEGYVAICPDIFHRETERVIPFSDMAKAIATMQRVQDPKAMEDVGAAIAHLKSQRQRQSRLPRRRRFLHGRPANLFDRGASRQRREVRGALLSAAALRWAIRARCRAPARSSVRCIYFFGAKDQLIPMDQVDQIKTELTTQEGRRSRWKSIRTRATAFSATSAAVIMKSRRQDAWEKDQVVFCAASEIDSIGALASGRGKVVTFPLPFLCLRAKSGYIDGIMAKTQANPSKSESVWCR